MGIEPTLVAWEATVLPLNYTRFGARFYAASPAPANGGPGQSLVVRGLLKGGAFGFLPGSLPILQETDSCIEPFARVSPKSSGWPCSS